MLALDAGDFYGKTRGRFRPLESGFLFGLCASAMKALGQPDWAIRSDYMRNASTLHWPNTWFRFWSHIKQALQEDRKSNFNIRDSNIGKKLALAKLVKLGYTEFRTIIVVWSDFELLIWFTVPCHVWSFCRRTSPIQLLYPMQFPVLITVSAALDTKLIKW